MKRIVMILLILFSTHLRAATYVFHVFPVVLELKELADRIQQNWYVLLGKNAEKDLAFTVGNYQEFGGTITNAPQSLVDQFVAAKAVDFITKATNSIYSQADLSSLIKKETNKLDTRMIKITDVTDKAGATHVTVYVLCDVRKSLARLNSEGRSPYKTEFRWFLISDIARMDKNQLRQFSILQDTQHDLHTEWDSVQKEFIRRLCSSSK